MEVKENPTATENINIAEINELIQKESGFVDLINMEVKKVIVGQQHMIESLLIGLLSRLGGGVLIGSIAGLLLSEGLKRLRSEPYIGIRLQLTLGVIFLLYEMLLDLFFFFPRHRYFGCRMVRSWRPGCSESLNPPL